MRALRRHNEPTKHGNPKTITFTEHRTRFPSRVRDFAEFPLKSGWNNKKLGRIITKGKWAGFPIYSLTLEERATCPTSCKQWSICYGNNMPFALRMRWSSAMEKSVSKQLMLLQRTYPRGFAIRLHVLGDFLSEEYAQWWIDKLKRFPALHIFGYTARDWSVIHEYAAANFDRFAIRRSGSTDIRGAYVTRTEDSKGITCPAQTGKTDCCGTCTLCWATDKPINFLEH